MAAVRLIDRDRDSVVVAIHSDFRTFVEPKWIRPTVERMLASVPDAYLRGLESIVLTEAQVTRTRRGNRPSRRNRQGVALGCYHRRWKQQAAWIELVVDAIIAEVPQPIRRIPILRTVIVGSVLFHEIGHHLDATLGSIARPGERGAEAWQRRLLGQYCRKRYWYLRPVVPALALLVRMMKRSKERQPSKRVPG